jgi:signal transduction histidine kinase
VSDRLSSPPSARPPTPAASFSLPAAKDLRARADRVIERAALAGTPRRRFLREQRRSLAARLLPTLAMIGVASGAAAVVDLFREPPYPREVTIAQGLTATVLAMLVLGTSLGRRNLAALVGIASAGTLVVVAGWGIVTRLTGGVISPYALAVPLGLTVILLTIPFPPRIAPVLALASAMVMAVSAPGAPPSAFIVFALLGAGGWQIARTRRRRALQSFRRVERLSGAIARIRQVQDQLVVVEKLEALRVLVGGIAQELNNSLAVALASTEQAATVFETNPAAAAKAMQRANGGLARIRGTIDRLRRFAMADETILEPADVCAMLDFALESAIGRTQPGIAIERDYDPSAGGVVTHAAALAEALFQVAKNAVESMPNGGTIRASVKKSGDSVVLSVADEGQGIPPARLAKVFDPFYAREVMDTLTKARVLPAIPGRAGLGLSAVYGVVSALGGKVEIESEVGKGTEVSIVLKVRAS